MKKYEKKSNFVRLFIADCSCILREGLKTLFKDYSGFKYVGDTGDEQSLYSSVREKSFDVLVLDINIAGDSFTEVIRKVLKINPDIKIVVLSAYEDECYLSEAIEFGARGYVLKKSEIGELVKSIQSVSKGGYYVDSAFLDIMIRDYIGRYFGKEEMQGFLTKQEEEELKMMTLGYTNLEIATMLSISRNTVEFHRVNIMKKLGLKTRAELVNYTLEKWFFDNNEDDQETKWG